MAGGRSFGIGKQSALTVYRPFRNTDPPALAEIWRSCADCRGLVQPMSAALFEQHVLNKTYFEREGLLLAVEDGLPVGFVHAGFGPNDEESALSTELGVTSLLVVHPQAQGRGIEEELLARSEQYLISRGARVLYGGSIRPLNPFYVGLYGGSELPGLLDSDAALSNVFRQHGYRAIDHTQVLRRELAGFRPPIDRVQMQIRRRTQLAVVNEPPARTWWEACTWGEFELAQYQLLDAKLGKQLAHATLRNLSPSRLGGGAQVSGLIDIQVESGAWKQGLGTFLLGEVMKELDQQGVGVLEAQTMEQNGAALALYRKLGFTQVDAGTVYRKEAGGGRRET